MGAFGTARMLNDYVSGSYLPAAGSGRKMLADGLKGARELKTWMEKIDNQWGDVKVLGVNTPDDPDLPVGKSLPVEVEVQLGKLDPAEVLVQLYHGKLNPKDEIQDADTTVLEFADTSDGKHTFKGEIPTDCSGKFGFAVRVLPHNDLMATIFDTERIHWA